MSQSYPVELLSTPIRSMSVEGFTISERVHAPNWTLTNHSHQSGMIEVILDGGCTETIIGRSNECVPRSLQIVPVGEAHSIRFGDKSVRCLAIEVTTSKLSSISCYSKVLERPLHLGPAIVSSLITKLYKEFQTHDISAALTVEGVILQALGVATKTQYSRSEKKPKWLEMVRSYIEENAVKGVGIFEIASVTGFSPAYVARTFKRVFGCTIGEYAREIRLDRATEMLTHSNLPLPDIAIVAGFYDQSHFTNIFKASTGLTPAEFRKCKQTGQGLPKRARPSNAL